MNEATAKAAKADTDFKKAEKTKLDRVARL